MPPVQDSINEINSLKSSAPLKASDPLKTSDPLNDPLKTSDQLKTSAQFDTSNYPADQCSPESSSSSSILRDCVRSVLSSYISDLEGHTINDLYQLVLAEVEPPLLETILEHAGGNQSKAAQMLGINRGTLRKKLKQYNISE